MKVAITGATGFLGRYLVERMIALDNECRCWHRPTSDRSGFEYADGRLEWCEGALGDEDSCHRLVAGCDAVIHSGLHRTGAAFRGGEGDLSVFVQKNVLGTVQLIDAARNAGADRFVFISTCSVHEKLLDDRPLDEAHPLWAITHYGAHKAAVEQFVHSYGFGAGFNICAVRPTGIYGVAHVADNSKWYDLIRDVAEGREAQCRRGGKEVHASDVALAVDLLLHADDIAGEVYSCYDRYVSEYDVAAIAKEITGSTATIAGEQTRPKHQIVSDKIKALGMRFGGDELLRSTIRQIADHVAFHAG